VIDVDDECVPPHKKPKKIGNVDHKFLKFWAVKMPWEKPIFNAVGLVNAMKCHVCTKIKRKENKLIAKWDFVEKHVGKKKVLMINGPWIQNVCTLKMKSLMFNFLQPLSFRS
jgi:hypothetical protein